MAFEKDVKIKNKTGMHAKPAADFVKKVNKYSSKISVIFEGKEVNAKDVMAVMGLGVAKGNQITIKAEGDNAKTAVEEIIDFVKNDMVTNDY
ncbi:HPr family phosphocarrier protein [Halanaerobium hydrogeniformans]|uniref:Phosphocarrier protein HPr n=1 Tax=Halanaerobium hydrogeniformans TaxID=656519 RepID=E4RNV7_HALHG|nr:HPr family phosphocarrier protein [Halanaerobium hydrogeniformans]ADQ13647.1 Phosphotransferase system, phosphocarrier protein HPr [Halanaerobium hydrogeniformans]